MRTLLLFIVLLAAISISSNAQGRMSADTAKTRLLWLGERAVGQEAGTIKLKDGWLSWQDNKITSGEFIIDMTTIQEATNKANLEKHLRSDDFFSVDKFPESKLVITGSDPFERGYGMVKGLLTIKGITNPVEVKAAFQKKDDGTWFFANFIIDRTKYDVRYGSGTFFDNLGDRTIFDEFKVRVSLLVK